MTTLVERQQSGDVVEARPPVATYVLGVQARALLATLSAAAGAIHLALAPSHAGESAVEGVGFLLAGWVQIVAAILIVARPSRLLLKFVIAVNVALVSAWAFSRVWGLPIGEHAWHAESVSVVDLTCVTIEAALILVCAAILFRPTLGRSWHYSRLLGFAAPIAIIVLASAVLVSPSARDHAAGSHGDHLAAAHDHDEDDLGLSALDNGHQHGEGEVELDRETQIALTSQLNQTRVLIDRYPTIADAEAAGYARAGPFSPGLGTHYINFAGYLDDNPDAVDLGGEVITPVLVFDGLEPDAPLAGFMLMTQGAEEPEGFVGSNDHWHYHTHVCLVFEDGVIEAPLGADRADVSPELCEEYGGGLIESTGYMLHVWTVPGYESDLGVFSEINPALRCPDGTYYTKPIEELGFSPTLCRD